MMGLFTKELSEKEQKEKALRKDLLKLIKLATQRKLTQKHLDTIERDYKRFYDTYGWNKQSTERLKTIEKLKVFI